MSSLEVIDEEALAPKPWEDCADFEPDLTLEMADGSGSLRVNRLVLATNSTLVRDCPSIDGKEPIPITVSSISALETLCRVMYANALTREQFSFPYDIFTVVTEVYELATFLGCKKILETFQTELEKSIQDLISKDKSEVENLFGAFDALIVIESVCKNKVWTKNELTLLYRCVHFGDKTFGFVYSKFSIVHAKLLSPKTMLKVLQMSSQTSQNSRFNTGTLLEHYWTPKFDGIECKD